LNFYQNGAKNFIAGCRHCQHQASEAVEDGCDAPEKDVSSLVPQLVLYLHNHLIALLLSGALLLKVFFNIIYENTVFYIFRKGPPKKN